MAELTGNLLVAQSGGPTCAINASVAGVIMEAGDTSASRKSTAA
jgi:6-phosphofructokinase